MSENRKYMAIFVGLFLVLTVVSPLVAAQDNGNRNDVITISYSFDEPVILENGNVAKVAMDDCAMENIPGMPIIPKCTAQILLPQGKDVKSINVVHGKPVLLDSGVVLEHGQPPAIIGQGAKSVEPNPEVYGSDRPYPVETFSVGTVAGFRGFDILHVSLYPVCYIPKAGKILYFPEMTVQVMLTDGELNSLYRGEPEDIMKISETVDNPETVSTYSTPGTPQTTGVSPGDYDYVIITDSAFTADFQTLLNHKSLYTTTNIVDTTYIDTNYAGTDLQEKIRNFIKDAYTNWGTTYVLLGGDIEVIPYRGFYGYVDTWPFPTIDHDIPADLYYAALDGTWNDDGDADWGELEDNPDWYAEVYVGRAPVNTATEISNFIDKVIAYETTTKPNTIQLHQSRLSSGNSPDSQAIPEACAQWIPGTYTVNKLYEETETVTKTKWSDAFANGRLIVQQCGHGDNTVYGINYENGGAVDWYNSDALGLTNSFYPMHMSIACYSGNFYYSDCLAEAYLLNTNGGTSACILNSRYGWYSSLDANKFSGEFMERQFYELFQTGIENWAKMMQVAKEHFATLASGTGDGDVYRWCYYEINLLGDPETPGLTTRGGNQPPTCTLTADPSSGEAPLTTTFYMTANDPDGTIASWELDVDNNGTAEYSGSGEPPATQQHTYNDPGEYTAKLTVWDNEGASGYDTTIVTVTEPNVPPYKPSDPDPYNGAIDVSLNPTLSVYVYDPNGDAMDVSFYDELGVLIGTDTGVVSGSRASVIWSGLDPSTTYGWYAVADDNRGGTNTSDTWYFTTGEPKEKLYTTQDIPVQNGGITNDHTYTHVSDNVYEGITERETTGKPDNRYSYLEHKWTIDVTSGYTSYIFYIEAHHTANSEVDDFVFAYSTDNVLYTDMVTVTKTSDDNTYQTYTLPTDLSGTVYIRVVDTDQTPGNRAIDTIYTDHMYIEAGGTPPPNRPPNKPINPDPANGATGIDINPTLSVDVSDPDNDAMNVTFYDASTHTIIGTDYNVPSGTRASVVWSGLAYDTTYSWYTVADDGEYTNTSATWSFTTRIETPPGGIYVWDISWREKAAGPNTFLYYTVTVRWDSDYDGIAETTDELVSDATVYSTLTQLGTSNSWSHSGITDANGQIEFAEKVGPGDYKAEVTDITHSTYTYNPGLDVDNPDYYTVT